MSQAPVVRRRGSRDLTPNHKRLYQLVRRAGSLSRADLMRQSGLTFPSISRLVTDLLAFGLLKEGASRRGGMGKPPVELGVVPSHGYSLGIYLDGDTATSSLVNALGETLKKTSFPAVSLTQEITNTLGESSINPDRLIGVSLATPEETIVEEDRQRLSSQVNVPIIAVPMIACSVRAERYFGSGGQLGRFLYFDAALLELGVVVNGQVLARPGTLSTLLRVQQGKPSPERDVLPEALRGAAALIQAEALVVGGSSAEDLETLNRQIADLPVVPAAAQANDPALAAAAVLLDETFGV